MKINNVIPVFPAIAFTFMLTGISLPTLAQIPNPPQPRLINKYPGESSYNALMRLGYAAMQRQDYISAAQYFRSALNSNPRDRSATIAYWNAQNQIRKANQGAGKTDYDRYMKIAYNSTNQGDYQTALINFQRALAERPNDYYASQAIINVKTYINRGQKPTSADDVSSLPMMYAGETAYNRYMRLGYAAQQRRDFTSAMEYFRNALNVNPNDRDAIIAYWNVKDMVDSANNANSQQGNKYERQMRLGYDAVEADNYEQALVHFQIALQQRPNDYYATQAIRNINTYITRGQ